MRKGKQVDEDIDQHSFQIRPFQLWAILICGILLALIGGYLIIEGEIINGKAFSNGRMGPKAGTAIILNGPIITILGLLISVFPTYQLIKQSKSSKNTH